MLLYVKYAVPHYWILDSDRLTLEMYELQEGNYKLIAQSSKEEQAQSLLFPGLAIPMANLGQ
jgi:Uma2 family endonuclease